MPVIPAIDVIKGGVVRLAKGDFNKQTDYPRTPEQRVAEYEDSGAERIHLVDLDGARDPKSAQLDFFRGLLAHRKAFVQVGGGIRSIESAEALLAAGANAVVIGSMAVVQPEKMIQLLERFGTSAIVLALDVNVDMLGEAYVATHGWQEGSGKKASEVLQPLVDAGLEHVLCTDIARDGMMQGPNVLLYQRLMKAYPSIKWQASGGVSNLDDIRVLASGGVSGAITGRALLEGVFTYQEAAQCWQNASSPA